MVGGAMAKLHSLVASNSLVWRSFMIARTSMPDCSAVRARSICGRISPSILIAGGKFAVMNRSEAAFSTQRLSSSCISLMAWSRSMKASLVRTDALSTIRPALLHRVLIRCLVARFFLVHNAPRHQLRQALVERLHAGRLAGLYR